MLFASAAAHKLRSGARFHAQLAAYQLLPEFLAAPAAWLLALMELALVPLLLLPATRAGAGTTAAALLLFYAAAIAINLLRGRNDIDCGCGSRPQPLSWWLLLRNVLLASGALMLTLHAPATSFAWSDLLIAVPAIFALCLLYQGAEQLLANAATMRPAPQGSHTGSKHEH